MATVLASAAFLLGACVDEEPSHVDGRPGTFDGVLERRSSEEPGARARLTLELVPPPALEKRAFGLIGRSLELTGSSRRWSETGPSYRFRSQIAPGWVVEFDGIDHQRVLRQSFDGPQQRSSIAPFALHPDWCVVVGEGEVVRARVPLVHTPGDPR